MLDRSIRGVNGSQMARPRSFSTEKAIKGAAAVFWSTGYRDTAISDLERATGLNRSSLYSAFGTKQAIFGLALQWYLRGFVGPRLAPMERPGARLDDIERFFAGLVVFFRAGVHTGEVELASGGISGIAVHAGARIAALAAPSEILVSATVKDLVPGSGLRFEERGTHALKGLPGQYALFAAVTGP